MNFLSRSISVLACVLMTPTSNAESLSEIYELALVSDPGIREAQANLEAALQIKPQARGFLLPQIDASGSWTDSENDGDSIFGLGSAGIPSSSTTESDGTRWDVQLRQTLFRWDQWLTLKKASKQVAQAEADYLAAQHDLIIRVGTAYFDALAAKDTLESEQAAKEAIGRQLEQAQKRFEVGLIAITDVQEAQAGYDQATAAEILAKRNLATRGEILREIVGEYQLSLDAPKEEIPLEDPVPADEDAWVQLAITQNPVVLSSELALEIARDDKRIARTGHYPTIDFVASYGETDIEGTRVSTAPPFTNPTAPPVTTTTTTLNDTSDQQFGVQVSVPIFSGGTTSARVKEATYRQRAARERLERALRQAERETRDAYLGVISEISRVKALKQALASAQTALEATDAGYEVGTRTTVDVLDARRLVFSADVNYARSRYDYIINILRLKQAAGSLSAEDVNEINAWLEPSAAQ